MKAVIQRINYAKLTVEDKLVSQCGAGFLVLLGFTHNDDKKIVDYVVDRVCGMRLFRDENGKTNKSSFVFIHKYVRNFKIFFNMLKNDYKKRG